MIEVIIPAYNCSSTLSRTLHSLCSQIDNKFCVLVVDDCSTENILDIVENFADKLNIRYIKNKKNMGCAITRQIGIKNTIGDYVTFLDSDDVFMPYTIEVFNQMSSGNPDVEMFDSKFYEEKRYNDTAALLTHGYGNIFCHGKLYKTSFLQRVNIGRVPERKYADDIYLNTICYELTDVKKISIPMLIWVDNQNSIMRKTRNEQEFQYENFRDFLDNMCIAIDFILKFKNLKDFKLLKELQDIEDLHYNSYSHLFSEEQLKHIHDGMNKLNQRIKE